MNREQMRVSARSQIATASTSSLPSSYPREIVEPLQRLEGLLETLVQTKPRQPKPEAWEKFLSLPPTTQSLIVKAWNEQSDFVEGAIKAGLRGFDEVGMLSYALGRLNLLSDPSLLADIEPGDIIEISDSDYVQVYRSYSYFSLCNYSLLELSGYPWFELYERCSSVTKQLLETVDQVLSGKIGRASWTHVPEYTLQELMTEERATFTMREKFIVRVVSAITGKNYVLTVKSVKELQQVSSVENRVRFL